ncbi:MAG TPA: four helix bundle protein [Chloroflexia bacterium]|jgi:four helix bundle protein|nr:four helix bundle protein [Chloroflexia bacterium]
MNKTDLERRTKAFAVSMITFVGTIPRTQVTNVLGNQLLRSGTSIGANYREANRAASRSDFTHKVSIAEKEAAETQYWLELLDALAIGNPQARASLLQESSELLAIFTSIGKSLKNNR